MFNYAAINEKIIKICQGLGYTLKMYDAKGAGPIVDPEKVRYFYLEPNGLMIRVPMDHNDNHNEIVLYCGINKDTDSFLSLIKNLKTIAHFNGLIGLTIRNYDSDKVSTKQFSDEAKNYKDKV